MLFNILFLPLALSQLLLPPIPADFRQEQNANVAKEKQLLLQGFMNHYFHVELTIDMDDLHCSGKLIQTKTNLKFQVSGTYAPNKIQLLEITENNNISGFIELEKKIHDSDWKGFWYNYNRSIQLPLHLKENNNNTVNHQLNRNLPSLKRLNGKLLNQQAVLLLYENGPSEKKGFLTFPQTAICLQLEEFIHSPDSSTFKLFNNLHQQQGILIVKDSREVRPEIQIQLNNRTSKNHFQTEESIPLTQIEFAHYCGGYGIQLPSIQNNAFMDWTYSLFEDWIADCEKSLSTLRNKVASEIQARNQAFYLGWTEVRYLNDRIISGLFFLATPTNGQLKMIEFNFDLHTNQPINIRNLFWKKPDLKDLCDLYAPYQIEMAGKELPNEWKNEINKLKFEHFTISKEGIWAYSSYNNFWGSIPVLLPAQVLKKSINDSYWEDLFFEPNY